MADKPEACTAWVLLEDTLQKALVLNQCNGRFINQGLLTSQKALNVLRAAGGIHAGLWA